MQEVSGSIPLGSTILRCAAAENATAKSHSAKPDRLGQRSYALASHLPSQNKAFR